MTREEISKRVDFFLGEPNSNYIVAIPKDSSPNDGIPNLSIVKQMLKKKPHSEPLKITTRNHCSKTSFIIASLNRMRKDCDYHSKFIQLSINADVTDLLVC